MCIRQILKIQFQNNEQLQKHISGPEAILRYWQMRISLTPECAFNSVFANFLFMEGRPRVIFRIPRIPWIRDRLQARES
jgi:hypothetical protein